MSLLHWVEHCVECAAPSCYETCDLYEPRFDLRCRRFTYGAQKNTDFCSLRGYGVEISFKKWAKLEAFGSLALMPVWVVRSIEALALSSAPVGDALGNLMAKITGRLRWFSATHLGFEELVRRIALLKQDASEPHAFLLEVFNPGVETIRMQLTFSPVKDADSAKHRLIELSPLCIKRLDFTAGYSRHVIEFREFRAVTKTGRPFLISMVPEAEQDARLVFLSADLVQFDHSPQPATEANEIKCVVWDLDNTLWDGILTEGDKVAVRPETISLLKLLDSRGILMSVASKNDHASAWQKLEELGISEYFLYPQIHWGPKSESIKTIAARLNIGIDTVAFIDDSSFELDQVTSVLPAVFCVNALKAESLRTNNRFAGSTSADSKERRRFYRDAMERETEQENFGRDYMAFLSSCDIQLEVSLYGAEDAERVAELVQRTNQLNFSGRKYTRPEMDRILLSPIYEKLVLKCSDRYGPYGTVGFALIQTDDGMIRVHDFMLSCRVQGKLIEQAFFHHLSEHHNPHGATGIWVNFRPTARNKPAAQVLESLGFRKSNTPGDQVGSGLILESAESLECKPIHIRCTASSSDARKSLLSSLGEGRTSAVPVENPQL